MDGLGSDDPQRIGAYRLLGRLGEGGMGRVYLARSDRGRTVAVKVVRAELARQPDFRRRFAQEINAARRVGRTDAAGDGGRDGPQEMWTAPVLDADTEAATPWVATGYVAGPSLQTVVDADYGPLPEPSVRALAGGLVRALRTIHDAGLIHRDLKPSNILITIDGPRVIDFGIARALDTVTDGGLTRTGAVIGSPGFMSPEQVRGVPATPASDVFCLGTVLAYAATGRMPFGTADSGVHALMFRIAEEEPDLAGLSGPLLELVTACLAKDPVNRPSVAELLERTAADARLSGAWLPGEVLAQLGRHAIALLDSEDPETRASAQASWAAAPDAPPAAPPPPTSPPTSPPTPPPASRPTPPPTSRPTSPPTSPPPSPQDPGASRAGAPPVARGFSTPPPRHGGQPGAAGFQPWQQGGTPPPGPRPAMGTPPPPSRYPAGGPAPRPLQPPRPLANAVSAALAVIIVFLLVDMVWNLTLYAALESATAGSYGSAYRDLRDEQAGTDAMAFIALLLMVPTIVLWVVWFWRVRTNAEVFAPGRVRHPVGMAIGCWFIPVGNLFLPKQITNDIWAAGVDPVSAGGWPGQRAARVPGVLNAWWTLWVVQLVSYYLLSWSSWYEAGSVSAARGQVALTILQDLAGIPAAVLAIAMVLRLTRQQEQRMARQPYRV